MVIIFVTENHICLSPCGSFAGRVKLRGKAVSELLCTGICHFLHITHTRRKERICLLSEVGVSPKTFFFFGFRKGPLSILIIDLSL